MIVFIVLFLILIGASFYIARRIHEGLCAFFPKVWFWPILTGVGILTLFLIMGFTRSQLPFPIGVKYVFGLISSYSMGIMLYLLLFTIIVDLITLVPKLMKLKFTTHRFFKGFKTVGVLLLSCIICICGFIGGSQIEHVAYDVTLQGKKDISDLNVVLISDLHLGSVGSEKKLQSIVYEINALKPDVVCIAGDFFDTDFTSIRDPNAAIKTLRELKSTYGTYACLGNHDGGKTHNQMTEFLENANITLLSDEYTVIDNRIVVVGRLDQSSIGGYGDKKRAELSSFFIREDPTLPVIVLDHNPANIDEYTTEADLILCGHTHKGQVFPGNLITDMIYTVDYGYYQKDNKSPQVIVTSGIGGWGMPMRVGSDCEIVSINFKCNQ